MAAGVIHGAVDLQRALEGLFHPIYEHHKFLGGIPTVHQHGRIRQLPVRHRAQHLSEMVYLAHSIGLWIEDTVVDHPEVLGFGIDVETRDYPDAIEVEPLSSDDAPFVAGVLVAGRLYFRPRTLLEYGVVEDQVRPRLALQKRLYLLEQ